ncbi:MAG TPA: SRPBCC domain-containing protein [Acidobacteriota bacterium]|nr:SRPBCC domain-containing protein [Acidobacteriota bacterium]
MKFFRVGILITGLILAVGATLAAEVVDASANGFTVRHQVSIAKDADQVYADIVDHVGSWWNPDHTFSMDASNLSIDDKAGGCFCEKLPDGGEVRHLVVVNAVPGKMLRMTGGLGPLQGMAVTGAFTITLTPQDGSTQVEFRYTVGGYAPGGLNAIAGPVDGVIGEQLARLKGFSESNEGQH